MGTKGGHIFKSHSTLASTHRCSVNGSRYRVAAMMLLYSEESSYMVQCAWSLPEAGTLGRLGPGIPNRARGPERRGQQYDAEAISGDGYTECGCSHTICLFRLRIGPVPPFFHLQLVGRASQFSRP